MSQRRVALRPRISAADGVTARAQRLPPFHHHHRALCSETFEVTALYFAAARWGDASGRYNYTAEANFSECTRGCRSAAREH